MNVLRIFWDIEIRWVRAWIILTEPRSSFWNWDMDLSETSLGLNEVERKVTGIDLILRRELEGTPFGIGPILLYPQF